MEVKRRNSKGINGHIRSSSLSNGRDRLSLYAPSYSASEESCSEKSREEISELMTHSLITTTGASNNNDKLAKNRKPLALKSAEKKARKVKFYRNGDRFFKGVTLAVSTEKYRTFDSLLSELNRLVGDRVNLHQGVRIIFTTDGSKINTIEELQVRCPFSLVGFYFIFIRLFLLRMVKATCVHPMTNLRNSNTTSVLELRLCVGPGSLTGREPSAVKHQ